MISQRWCQYAASALERFVLKKQGYSPQKCQPILFQQTRKNRSKLDRQIFDTVQGGYFYLFHFYLICPYSLCLQRDDETIEIDDLQ